MVRQVMQKQVRLCVDQIKRRNVLLREERNLKGSKQVRTKQNVGVKGRNRETDRVGKTD